MGMAVEVLIRGNETRPTGRFNWSVVTLVDRLGGCQRSLIDEAQFRLTLYCRPGLRGKTCRRNCASVAA